jgi:hypothetical protein
MTTSSERGQSSPVQSEPRQARFVVGIDLGTTNSALASIDTRASQPAIRDFLIPQVVAAGVVERFETLPSFHYEPAPGELAADALRLPWQTQSPASAVGVFARDAGRARPERMIESAKSWLCHHGVDRRAALLPWQAAEDASRLSPVDASAKYLAHLRAAWNADHPDEPLERQDVVLTIPASFDEVARELTVAAARKAGLPRIVLLEEPQAAFYSWVDAHPDEWDRIVSPGQTILVCDIGGGTTDFSLIHVRRGDDGRARFHRVAVGDHLLLGGDNLDLALAHHVEQRLSAEQDVSLSARQWGQLLPACRHAKEMLLSAAAPETYTLVIAGGGSRLIGGSLSVELRRGEVESLLADGFLPDVPVSSHPQRRQSGFREFGLPYAADPAMTKYLAAFLSAHGGPDGPARPDVVLFNGGFFASPVLRQRLMDQLAKWFQGEGEWRPVVLKNDRLDLAVARGASYFGLVRRGIGVRIVAGLAQTYYIGVEQADGQRRALCLIAAGTEAGAPAEALERVFRVRTSEPVEFPVYVSGTRLNDRPGNLIEVDPEQLTALPSIRTVLTSRAKDTVRDVEARVTATLTEIGTLELWCQQVDGSRRWQLQFDVRPAVETDRAAHTGRGELGGIAEASVVTAAAEILRDTFGLEGSGRPDELMKRLADAIGQSKSEWSPSLLRALWSELRELADGRTRSAQHEARWLNLAGYCLRPGFGLAADDWRVEETWRSIHGRLVHGTPACLAELRTLCRRISGGLPAGQQKQIAATVLATIRPRVRQIVSGKGRAAPYASGSHEASEIWRMLGSFELLETATRIELGRMALELMNRSAMASERSALIAMLGRVGSRVPVYGPLNLTVPGEIVCEWILALLDAAELEEPVVQLSLMQLSRRTGDRSRDVDSGVRQKLLERCDAVEFSQHLRTLIADGGRLEQEDAGRILGESLPAGLRLA